MDLTGTVLEDVSFKDMAMNQKKKIIKDLVKHNFKTIESHHLDSATKYKTFAEWVSPIIGIDASFARTTVSENVRSLRKKEKDTKVRKNLSPLLFIYS